MAAAPRGTRTAVRWEPSMRAELTTCVSSEVPPEVKTPTAGTSTWTFSMLIPGRDRRCIRGLGSEGRPLLDEQHRQIGFLIRPQAARLPLANAPVAQPAEAGPLKGPQCGFESHRGHRRVPGPDNHVNLHASIVTRCAAAPGAVGRGWLAGGLGGYVCGHDQHQATGRGDRRLWRHRF